MRHVVRAIRTKVHLRDGMSDMAKYETITSTVEKHIHNRTLKHQFSDTNDGFKHRMICEDIVGQWAGYEYPAVVEIHGEKFIGTTDYFDGALPDMFYVNTGS